MGPVPLYPSIALSFIRATDQGSPSVASQPHIPALFSSSQDRSFPALEGSADAHCSSTAPRSTPITQQWQRKAAETAKLVSWHRLLQLFTVLTCHSIDRLLCRDRHASIRRQGEFKCFHPHQLDQSLTSRSLYTEPAGETSTRQRAHGAGV